MIAHQSSQTNACCNKTRSIDRCMWCGYNHKMHDCWLHHQFRMGTEFCGRQLEEKLPRKDEQSRCALALRGDEPPASEAAFNWKRWAPKPKPHLICASCWELTGCYSLWLGRGFSGCIILGLLWAGWDSFLSKFHFRSLNLFRDLNQVHILKKCTI